MHSTTPSVPPILILLVGVLMSGCVEPSADIEEPVQDCPGHWHFMLGFYIHNELVPFDNLSFLRPGATELHWDTGRLVHIHPHPSVPRCVPLRESMETFQVWFEDTRIELGPAHGDHAGSYPLDDGSRLVVRIAPHGEAWRDADLSGILPHTAPNGARILFSHGDPSEDDLRAQEASVALVPSRYLPSE